MALLERILYSLTAANIANFCFNTVVEIHFAALFCTRVLPNTVLCKLRCFVIYSYFCVVGDHQTFSTLHSVYLNSAIINK
jgi:hypothetical protein